MDSVARYLITTADESTWKFDRPVIFLGEWCRIYDRRHIWEDMDAIVSAHQGIFDRHVEWLKPKPEFIIDDLMALVGPGVIESSVMEPPNRLGCLLSVYYAPYRRFGILAIALKRRAYHRSEKIDWTDIYHIVASGTGEGFNLPNKIQQENIANHEAGHALIMMLESNCANVPDIASIQPGKGYVGIVLESTENYHKEDGATSFSQACSRIRVNLAGQSGSDRAWHLSARPRCWVGHSASTHRVARYRVLDAIH